MKKFRKRYFSIWALSKTSWLRLGFLLRAQMKKSGFTGFLHSFSCGEGGNVFPFYNPRQVSFSEGPHHTRMLCESV
jgi:hypothetical protein